VSRASLPSGRAVSLSTHVRRFVAVIAAIVVGVAHPQFGNAFAVFTAKFRAGVASAII